VFDDPLAVKIPILPDPLFTCPILGRGFRLRIGAWPYAARCRRRPNAGIMDPVTNDDAAVVPILPLLMAVLGP